MTKKLEFFYDFSCPYAYLGSTRVRELAQRTGAELIYKPFLLGGVFRALGVSDSFPPARVRMNGIDMQRWAAHFAVPLNMPPTHPNRTVTALRALLASEDLPRATHALFDAYWVDSNDLSDPAVIARALDRVGLDGARCVKRAEESAIKDELRKRTDEAVERGIFGAPAFFVDGGELLWGQDRLDFVERALGREPDPIAPTPTRKGGRFEFWYDFSSPFAYLASTQVEQVADRWGATIEWRPFLLGALFRAVGTPDVPIQTFAPAKQRYYGADMLRFARLYGVRFEFPSRFPIRSVLPLRVALAAGADRARATHAIFRAAWADDRDITAPDELREILRAEKLDPTFVDRAEHAEIKDALRANTAEAESKGVPGAPSFVVGDSVFWGQDRIGFVEKALAAQAP